MAGAQRAGMQQLSFQINDVATMYAMGAKPMQIFASQSGQVMQALQMMNKGTTGFAAFMGGPWGMALTTGTLVLATLASQLWSTEKALQAVEVAADNTGQAQSLLGQMFDLTTGKIKDNTQALRDNIYMQMVAMEQKAIIARTEAENALSESGLGRTTATGRAGSRLFGFFTQERPIDTERRIAAQEAAGRKWQSLGRGVAQGGLSREDAGRLLEAQRGKLGDDDYFALQDFLNRSKEENTATQAVQAMRKALDEGKLDEEMLEPGKPEKPKVDRRAERLAREADATESLITNLGKLADAYLESDAAALKAEVTAKATEQGIKKQADVGAYVARQLRLEVAERTSAAAEAVGGLERENAARADLNDRVEKGLITSQDAARQLKDEAELRPYLAALAHAEGDAKTKLIGIIDRLRGARATDNREAIREQGLAMLAGQRDAIAIAEVERRHAGAGVLERGEAAQRAALNAREREVSTLRLKQELLQKGIGLESDHGRQILANHALILTVNEDIAERNAIIAAQADAWAEAQRIGEGFIDTVLDPANWDDWGDIGKRVLRELMNDMIRLGAINPIKNMLFGTDLPVLSGVLGALGIGGGGGSDITVTYGGSGERYGFASGTHHAPGGFADVGEFGPERVFLPAGSRVMTAADTRRLRGSDGGVSVSVPISIDATGADAAALARVEQQIALLRRDLPGQIVATVNDARQRGMVR
jgi:hypothetical protein